MENPDRVMGAGNPEALHDISKNLAPATGPGFVNPGTPSSPLVAMEQLINPETSKEASKGLMQGLIK